jgi:hypothetical protein
MKDIFKLNKIKDIFLYNAAGKDSWNHWGTPDYLFNF